MSKTKSLVKWQNYQFNKFVSALAIRPEFEFAKIFFKGLKLENKNLENNKLNSVYYKLLEIIMFIYAILLLSIFIIPTDILDKCQICASFTNFMKQFIPSIEIFGSTSKIPQVVMFYSSYMWLFLIISFCLLFYFNTRILLKNNSKFFKNKKEIIFAIVIILFFTCLFYDCIKWYFYGNLVIEKVGIFAKDFYPTMSSRLEIFFWTAMFYIGFMSSIAFLTIFLSLIKKTIEIKLYTRRTK